MTLQNKEHETLSAAPLTQAEADTADPEWMIQGQQNQLPLSKPETWLLIGGRGSGKTRTGAEWVNGQALGFAPMADRPTGPIALVGETLADVREVMVEGPAGILANARAGRARFEPSRRRLVWEASGMVAYMFSSEDPESLRGPQFAAAWCDELAKWKNAQATWDMLQFGLRLGERPRALVTTTPRPVPLLKRLMSDTAVKVTRMRTVDNAANLAPQFMENMRRQFAGTRLGRQELEGELIEDRDDALWSRGQLESLRVKEPDGIGRIVVAVDPPASSTKNADACGIIAVGLDAKGIAHVLADGSISQASPHAWAERAVQLFHELKADQIIAEVNQGGEMVEAVIRTIDPVVPVTCVRAQRGKWLRAEPVASLYAQGRVRHAAYFPLLEDEMCNFGRDGMADGRSPDRLDALVWAINALLLNKNEMPRVRQL
jgi:phage terminase large subunit-like protein